MADIKTKATDASVEDFINSIADEQKRTDSFALLKMMQQATREAPKMWGASLIGFGQVKLKNPKTGREVEWLKVGFSPRKANLSLYISGNINQQHAEALSRLGKHKTGLGCLYINKLADVDPEILRGMIEASLKMDFYFG